MRKQLWMSVSGLLEYDDTLVAVLVVTQPLVELVLARRKAFEAALAADDSLYQLSYWDYHPDYCSISELHEEHVSEDEEDELSNAIDSRGLVWFAEADEIDTESIELARTDCDQMHITRDGVYWSAYLNHTDLLMETYVIPWADLLPFVA